MEDRYQSRGRSCINDSAYDWLDIAVGIDSRLTAVSNVHDIQFALARRDSWETGNPVWTLP
jgi:hypothetical protein